MWLHVFQLPIRPNFKPVVSEEAPAEVLLKKKKKKKMAQTFAQTVIFLLVYLKARIQQRDDLPLVPTPSLAGTEGEWAWAGVGGGGGTFRLCLLLIQSQGSCVPASVWTQHKRADISGEVRVIEPSCFHHSGGESAEVFCQRYANHDGLSHHISLCLWLEVQSKTGVKQRR